jgi:site-specific DNA-methyltransferase (adenine-specific)
MKAQHSLESVGPRFLRLEEVTGRLDEDPVVLFPPLDVRECLTWVGENQLPVRTVILDPWYNKGKGGVTEGYDQFILELLELSSGISDHVFLWGFPEIVATFAPGYPPRSGWSLG